MKYQFKIYLTDKDYLDFNLFMGMRSPYGKKQLKTGRIAYLILTLCLMAVFLLLDGKREVSILAVTTLVVMMIVCQLFFKRIFASSTKAQLKLLKKSGKLAYSPEAIIEFYDDVFVETTATNRTEQKYSSIERISVVDNKFAYIHISSVNAYILPFYAFSSQEQCDSFFAFIRTKCPIIDVY